MNPKLDDIHNDALCEGRQRGAVAAGLLFGLFSAGLDEEVRMEAEEEYCENAYDRLKDEELFEQRMRRER